MYLKDIAPLVEGELIGNPDCNIHSIQTLSDAKEGDASFVLEKKYLQQAQTTSASALITYTTLPVAIPQIIVKNSRKALATIIDCFHPYQSPSTPIPITSTGPDFPHVSNSTQIGPFCSIDPSSSIGENTSLLANISIGKNCKIGKNCTLHPNVVLYQNTVIGDNVVIHANSVIGTDGFGYYPDNATLKKIPHIGSVVIENDVEIGSNVAIDRGCLGKTWIKNGTKIDNLVHISHNTEIGSHCAIAAQVGFTGGCTLEAHVMVGGQAGFDNTRVGEKAIIAAKAGVTKPIKKKAIVSGFPAWDHKNELLKEAKLRQSIKRRAS